MKFSSINLLEKKNRPSSGISRSSGPLSENKGKSKIYYYLDHANELISQWNMKLSVILIVVGALGTVSKT